MRVLLVEDDPGVVRMIRTALTREGDAVDACSTGTDALWHAGETAYDVILLDVNLPGTDGFEICRRLRKEEIWTPVLLLSARGSTADRVHGLDAGADDYLVKPFSLEELRARMRALVRRGAPPRPPVLSTDDLRLDPASRTVVREGEKVPLTAREFGLLELLVPADGAVVTRDEIRDKLWDFAFEAESNVVEAAVRRLRKKVDEPFGRSSVETVRGAGYRFNPEA